MIMAFSETITNLGKGSKLKNNSVISEVQQQNRKGKDIRTFELKADFTNANKVFYDKYDDIVAPVLYESLDKSQNLHSGQNSWFRFYKKPVIDNEGNCIA